MTLENANEIRKLLNFRDELISQLRHFKDCACIDGHINDGANGLGFRWDKDDRQIKHLIDGTTKEIRDIEEMISNF